MFKVVVILFIGLVSSSYGELRQQHPPSSSWGRSAAVGYRGGNVGYSGWAQPGNVGYGGGYRTQIAHTPYAGAYRAPVAPTYGGALGGAYGGSYGGARGGAYRGSGGWGGGWSGGWGGSYAAPGVAPGVARVSQPVAVAQPSPYYGGRYGEDESYKPYSFGYNTVDEYGTQLGRQEVADGNGAVRGSYSYRDPNGQFRQVQYVADAAGFRAEVDTNEAGVVPHKPADVVYNVHK